MHSGAPAAQGVSGPKSGGAEAAAAVSASSSHPLPPIDTNLPSTSSQAVVGINDDDEGLHPLATPTLDRLGGHVGTSSGNSLSGASTFLPHSPSTRTPQGTIRLRSHAHLETPTASTSHHRSRAPSSPSASSTSPHPAPARGGQDDPAATSCDDSTVQQRRPHQRPDYFDLKRLLHENEVRHGEMSRQAEAAAAAAAAQSAAVKSSRRASSVLGYPAETRDAGQDEEDDANFDASSVRRFLGGADEADTTWESRSTLGVDDQGVDTPGPDPSRRQSTIALSHGRHASMSAAAVAASSSGAWGWETSRPPSRSTMRSPPPLGASSGVRPVSSFFSTALPAAQDGMSITEVDAELNNPPLSAQRLKSLASLCLLGDAELERRILALSPTAPAAVTPKGTSSSAVEPQSSKPSVSNLAPLIRELSSALRQTLDEASAATSAEKCMRKSQRSTLSALQRRYEAREGALRGVLKGMGVSDARVDRELKHADGQAEIPKIVAERKTSKTSGGVRMGRGWGNSGTASASLSRVGKAESVGGRAMEEDANDGGSEANHADDDADGDDAQEDDDDDDDDDEEALPSSLREAMSEEMIDGGPGIGTALGIPWDSTGTLLRASPRNADLDLHRGRSTNSPTSTRSRADDAAVSSAVSTTSTKAGPKRPARMERSASTHSAASSRSSRAASTFAWGLWGSSNGGGASKTGTATGESSIGPNSSTSASGSRSRKAAAVVRATTGQDAEEMDGYLSEANVAAIMSRTPSASSSADQSTPSHSPRSARSMLGPSPATVEAEAKASSTSNSNSNAAQSQGTIASGLGLFGSLAWRRKKTASSSSSAQPSKQHQPSLPPMPVAGSMPMPKPRNRSTASDGSKASTLSIKGGGSGVQPTQGAQASSAQTLAVTTPTVRSGDSGNLGQDADETDASPNARYEDGERTIRGPSRPQTQHTPSGRSIGQAMNEAIGSAPPSPTPRRADASLESPAPAVPIEELPKPPHFRAIVLATRTMTSDASSLMGEERGKRAALTVASAALQLVGKTREEGKVIDDVPKPLHSGVRRPLSRPAGYADASGGGGKVNPFGGPPTSTGGGARLKRPMSMSVAASDARPSPPTPSGGSFAASATLGRALGRYANVAAAAAAGRKGSQPPSKSNPAANKVLEPNVTKLPDLFRFGGSTSTNARSPLASNATRLREDSSVRGGRDGGSGGGGGSGGKEMRGMGGGGQALPPVELEPIVPDDVKSPAMALISRKRSSLAIMASVASGKRRSRHSSSAGGVTTSSAFPSVGLRALDEEEDDSRTAGSVADAEANVHDEDDADGDDTSGDEFEVYGGKSLMGVPPPPPPLSSTTHDDDPAKLLTDRYGFVYDATPADVRLLRQARKASTPAPACLTGIKVGVRARGLDSQSEDEAKDDAELVSDEEEREEAMDRSESRSALDDVNSRSSPAAALMDLTSPSSEAGSHHTGSSSSRKIAGPTSMSGQPGTGIGMGIGIGLPIAPCKPSIEASALHVASQTTLAAGHTSPQQEREFHLAGVAGVTPNADVAAPDASTTTTSSIPAPGTSAASGRRPPNTSRTVRRLLGQLEEMHEEQQAEQQARWDDFLRRRRAAPRERAMEKDSAGLGATNSSGAGGSSKAGGGSGERREEEEEEDFGQGLVGLHRMGDSKLGKEHHAEFLRLARGGIPMVYRAKVWAECSGAQEVAEPGRYRELLDEHRDDRNACTEQIDLDVHRTMPTNLFFGGEGPGVAKLRRLLVAFSWYDPACGYCQGMNNLAATLLLTHASEEEAFWVLVCLIERMLPPEYYTCNLLVSQADQRVLMDLVEELLPSLANHLEDLGVDLPAVTFAWFLSLYTDCLPVETLFRVWDILFVEGDVILFRIAIGILALNSKELLAASSASALYGLVHSLTSRLFSVDALVKIACEDLGPSINVQKIKEKRAKHVADLRVEMGIPEEVVGPTSAASSGDGSKNGAGADGGSGGGACGKDSTNQNANASAFSTKTMGTVSSSSTSTSAAVASMNKNGSSFARLPTNEDALSPSLSTFAR